MESIINFNFFSLIFLTGLEVTFPLKNPILIFSLILFIILFAPILLNKIKIPHLIGLIIAGAIIGPNGLNLMLRDSSIILFGTVGLLYIMFLAGLEIDLADFKKNSDKSIIFGLYTFLIPMILGTAVGVYILDFPLTSSVLLASMFASHTLISYPIISKMGVSKNKAVNITVGGTMITDTLALLVLAVIVSMTTGELSHEFWLRLSMSVLIFGILVLLGFPVLGRWFFKRFDDNISQYIFVLGMVFLAAFLAEAAGMEGIIGAFLAGLALNRLIPHTSALMNRIEFVGNALFIPFFLIGVGMLIDIRAFVRDLDTIIVAIAMTTTATVAKFLAAWLTQKSFKFTKDQRRLIFGLSNAQAAATLAAILVAYNIIIGETPDGDPIRLLNESVLNGTILMILITCTIASFVAQKGAQNIALQEASGKEEEEVDESERILIPINYPESVNELINLSITVKSKHNKEGLYALNIINNNSTDGAAERNARKLLDKAAVKASATDNFLHQLLRYDINIANGINSVVREHKISDMIIGLHKQKGITDSFLGQLTEGILSRCNITTMIYKSVQPLSTIKKHVIIVPEKAENEIGFPFWLIRVWNIGRNTGAKLVFYASSTTITYLKDIHAKHPVEAEFKEFSDWNDFLIISREVKPNDNLLIILSRKGLASWHNKMAKIPSYLNKYFQENNFILVYPMQLGVNNNIDYKNPSVLQPLRENLGKLDDLGKTLAGLFRKK
ncbi:cation:proton antiporter [Cytophagaceae bacterium ABcell3]|nr:cation:proton antiporter [Cytophagaceae bacterium ABcell3]